MGRRPWNLANPVFFARVKEETAAAYPDLHLELRDGLVRLSGTFRLVHEGEEIDRYEIEVVLPTDFPAGVPDVYETAERIPRDADHHMYKNGRACLFVSGERWRYWPKGSTLVDFLNGPVRSFFIGQALYERGDPWPFEQRPHGAAGVLQAYGEMLRTKDPSTIVRYIEVLARKKLRPRTACPCGSGKPMHSCHMKRIASLRSKIPYREARQALAIVVHDLRDLAQARAGSQQD